MSVDALVVSRVDVSSSVLYHSGPSSSAAGTVLKLREFNRVLISTAIRNELHWLPINQHIVYKLSVCLVRVRVRG